MLWIGKKRKWIPMSNFAFTKQNELLILIPGEGTPLNLFFLLFDNTFVQLLVDKTNNFAE